MQQEPTPLKGVSMAEVPLPKAPLVRVIAQVRFPPILSILRADSVAGFQEVLRSEYPFLQKNDIKNIEFGLGPGANVTDTVMWRFSDRQEHSEWRVSLGVDFVALETWRYVSRADFINRLRVVLAGVEGCFEPRETQRLGLRYIDRLEGEAVSRISDLVQPGVLGILQPDGGALETLRRATVHLMTQAQFVAEEGVIQARWGSLPSNATHDPDALQAIEGPSWILDLDMFSPETVPFKSDALVTKTEAFAERAYSVFRLMVTDDFLRFYGGAV